MNMEDYEIACDVLLEKRNEVQQSIDNIMRLFKKGSYEHSYMEFQESLHFLHEKRNELECTYEQLVYALRCKTVEKEMELGG